MRTIRNVTLILTAAGIVYAAQAGEAFFGRIGAGAGISPAVDRASAATGQRAGATAFEALSPTDRALAQSIAAGQLVTPESEAPLEVDQIASARRAGGWDLVYVTLKAGRLTDARDTGELLRSARRRPVQDTAARPGPGRVTVLEAGAAGR